MTTGTLSATEAKKGKSASDKDKDKDKNTKSAKTKSGVNVNKKGTSSKGTVGFKDPNVFGTDKDQGEDGTSSVLDQTRGGRLRRKKIDEQKARDAVAPAKAKVMYRSKPRGIDAPGAASGVRQVGGNAAVATVPLNFHETQMNASKKRHVVDKGDSKSKNKNMDKKDKKDKKDQQNKNTNMNTEEEGGITITEMEKNDNNNNNDDMDDTMVGTSGSDFGLGLDTSKPNDTNPFFFDRNAKSIFYGSTQKKAPKFIARSAVLPKIDPSLIPETDDALSLLGASLLAKLDPIQLQALNCLCDMFADKDMDQYETQSDRIKIAVLDEIGL